MVHLAAMVGGLFKNMKYQLDFWVRGRGWDRGGSDGEGEGQGREGEGLGQRWVGWRGEGQGREGEEQGGGGKDREVEGQLGEELERRGL